MVKYTFLLPAFKARYFEEALLSIKHQTYTDFVCIVSDDCSPVDSFCESDKSITIDSSTIKSIFDKTVGDDPRFSYRRNEVNMGSKSLVAHWNMLVDMCETPYFMLACDDDLYKDTFLEEVDKLFLKYPEVGAVRARIQKINADGNVIRQDVSFPEYQNVKQYLYDECMRKHLGGILNFAFNTKAMSQEGCFPEMPIAWFSDVQSGLIGSKFGICNTKEILCSIRMSGINISRQRNTLIAGNKVNATFVFVPWVFNFIRDNYKADTIEEERKLSELIIGVKTWLCTDQLSFYGRVLSFRKRWAIYMFAKKHTLFPTLKSEVKYILYDLLHFQSRDYGYMDDILKNNSAS